jgi:hypothetical protein
MLNQPLSDRFDNRRTAVGYKATYVTESARRSIFLNLIIVDVARSGIRCRLNR